jgi:hypothetical protein
MSNQLQTRPTETFSLTPKTLEEAMKYSEMLARSSIVPKNYQGKAGDILVAVQMGHELGLKPIQSLQNIAVINGKPCIYGDACMALVKIHAEFEDVTEHFDESLQAAICKIKRRGQTVHTSVFTIEDAKKAGLWNRQGPWTQYPKRMLQMRARGFALRDAFPDALQGLILAEEAHDHPKEIEIAGESKTYASTTEKLIANLDTAKHMPIPQDAITENELPNEIIIETEIMPEISLAEQLTILIDEKAVPIEVIQKWLSKSGVKMLSEMSDDDLHKCIQHVHEKY